MCNKMNQHTARNIGKTHKTQCDKPEYKNGLCAYHYKRLIEKSKNWIDREGYREATQDDLKYGRSMKLKNSNAHKLFMYRNGVVKQFSSKQNKYIDSTYPCDSELFCVLDF